MLVKTTARPADRDSVLWAALILCGLLLGGLSIARYEGYNAGMFDLGNMAQAIWSGTQGQPLLYSTFQGISLSRLAGHVELFYFLLAPLYALWPDPRLLLAIQAGLYALGALPVYRLAQRRIGSGGARCLALIYLLYPTALTSVLFDFHADTLAMPILLFALDALDTRAWRRYALYVALALSCKVYVAAPVLGMGAYAMLWGGQRRAGVLTALGAALYGLVAFLVVRPLFAPAGLGGAAELSRGYLSYYFGQLSEIASTLGDRVLSAVVVFGPPLLVARHGWRWLLPGLPIAAAALLSTGPGGAYDFRYHHYALVVPFIVMAAIEGTAVRVHQDAQALTPSRAQTAATQGALRSSKRRSWRGDLGLTLGAVVIFSALLVDTPLNPLFWLGLPGSGLDPSAYGITARDGVKDRFLATYVPDGARLAASTFLATHLTNRSTLYLLRYPDEPRAGRLPSLLPQVDYALADALFDFYVPLEDGYGGGVDHDRDAIGLLLRRHDFGLVAARDGLLLFARGAAAQQALDQQIAILPSSAANGPAEYTFGDTVELLDHTIEPLGQHRLRVSFTWRALRSLAQMPLVAVSRLGGIEGARIVHLPTYALLPTTEWQPGQLVRETFEVELPRDLGPGHYTWRIGWYRTDRPASYATDERSRLPGSQEPALGEVVLTGDGIASR